MTIRLHKLGARPLNLEPSERDTLTERLTERFEPDATAEEVCIAEAVRREANVKAGRSVLFPGLEALERVRARLG